MQQEQALSESAEPELKAADLRRQLQQQQQEASQKPNLLEVGDSHHDASTAFMHDHTSFLSNFTPPATQSEYVLPFQLQGVLREVQLIEWPSISSVSGHLDEALLCGTQGLHTFGLLHQRRVLRHTCLLCLHPGDPRVSCVLQALLNTVLVIAIVAGFSILLFAVNSLLAETSQVTLSTIEILHTLHSANLIMIKG